ncbi:hypothetical protein NA56DRAFT_553469, partial [Hyaloscypha hepaticicola]
TARTTALILLGAVGALAAVNTLSKPGKTAGIANLMRRQLDDQNVHAEQDRHDTMLDRAQILKDVKMRKPWNQTSAERQRM